MSWLAWNRISFKFANFGEFSCLGRVLGCELCCFDFVSPVRVGIWQIAGFGFRFAVVWGDLVFWVGISGVGLA